MQGPLAAVFSGKYRGHSQYNHGKAFIASLFNEQMFAVPVVAANTVDDEPSVASLLRLAVSPLPFP